MHYLKTFTKDEAHQLIGNMSSTDESFEPAWNFLKSRYSNPRRVVSSHLEDLLVGESVPARSAAKLDSLLLSNQKALDSIKAQGVPVDHWDLIIIHLTLRRLPPAVREDWETSLGLTDNMPTYVQLHEFLKSKVRAWENLEPASGPKKQSEGHKSGDSRSNKPQKTTSSYTATQYKAKPRRNCPLCPEKHYMLFCPIFKAATLEERIDIVEKYRLCYNCLGPHRVADCKTAQGCRKCSQRHHTSIHRDTPPKSAPQTLADNAQDPLSAQVLLATALVQVRPHHGNPITARVLIDQGSELSFMRQSFFKKLGQPLQRDMVMLKGIGNVSAGSSLGVSTIELRSLCTTASMHVSMHILPTLTVDLPSFVIADPKWPHLENLKLADPQYLQPRPVDIILGASPAAQIMNAEIQRGPRNAPIAQSTTLGWIVYGAVTAKHASTSHAALHASVDTELQDAIAKFWEQEEVPSGNSPLNTAEEDECEIHFRQTHYRQPDGRYVVRLPLKALESQLGDSINAAMGSLRRLITRLSREREYSDMYRAFMAEYIQLGHMVRVPVNQLPANAYFLPHNEVLKLDSATTKLRTVFNGSCATSTGISSNDILHAGPKTQIDIFDMMLRICCNKILFATDITKMFRQIEVDSHDWPLQCILWIDENNLIDAYCLKTVTYGTASAPFDAVRVLIQLVKDEGHRFPLAVAPMLKTRYVDDIYGGADNEEDAIKAAVQTKALCAAGCFPLAKWASKSPRLLAEVAPEKQLDTPLKEISDAPVKVLGMYWNSRTDALQFKYTLPPETPKTK
ncbi:uncharacterized protein LOC123258948 [Cotesia glomerata]|uniref:uncharacterized protein LOC123258948 n=1 Tax=Cotesia glomerata TaxID=32391 RepID=UPI001D003D3B|nr:uncharacterized protein LOC123258948 [Cotesia glomerata]